MAMMELTADRRQYTGKEINRKRRVEGKIPGVIYGKGLETRSIEFQRKPLEKFLDTARRGTVVVKMTVQDGTGGKESYAVLKETQTHPLTGRVTHVDFYEVALGRKFRVEVPIRVKGKAVGIEMGGVLDVVTRSLEVECTPDAVPEYLELDVTSLGIGDSLHLADVRFPEGGRPHGEGSSDDPGGGPHAEGRGRAGGGRGSGAGRGRGRQRGGARSEGREAGKGTEEEE